MLQLKVCDLQVHCDGQLIRQETTLFAASLNTPTFGAGIPAVPQARMIHGRLVLLWAWPFSRLGALLMLPRLLMGWHLRHKRIHSIPFQALTNACASGVPLAADGEYLGVARQVCVRNGPASLQIVSHHMARKAQA